MFIIIIMISSSSSNNNIIIIIVIIMITNVIIVLAEGVAGPARTDAPAKAVVRIAPGGTRGGGARTHSFIHGSTHAGAGLRREHNAPISRCRRGAKDQA